MNRIILSWTILLIVFLLISPIKLEGQCDLTSLKSHILQKIQKDKLEQDTSYFLTYLTVGFEIKKRMGDKHCDTIRFMFQSGSNLKFYLISPTIKNSVRLKLLRMTGFKPKPLELIKEIQISEFPNTINEFTYKTNSREEFFLILEQNKEDLSCAVAAFTEYYPIGTLPASYRKNKKLP